MILDEIQKYTIQRYEKIQSEVPLNVVKTKALAMAKGDFIFEKALATKELSFICEVKKASPSKGLIATDFHPVKTAIEYEKAGATAISCLTEPHWFLGSDEYLTGIINAVSIPVLRKDFTVSEYQIYQSKILGASCVLLICALMDKDVLKEYIQICNSLGISALVEAHNQTEVDMALSCNSKIIGVNNRNLKDFTVDVNNSTRYRNQIGNSAIFVSESGITCHKDIEVLQNNKTDAVLIGETLMKSNNINKTFKELKYGEN